MDGDLQDPPEAIPLFVESYKQGNDVVYAQRVKRKEAWWLRACYYLFYRLLAALSTLQLPLDAGDFGLMSRRVIDEIRKMPEHHRYIRGMRTWVGFRQIGIPIERAVRHAGRTKYSPLRLLKLASDGIFAFSIVPLRAAAILGATATGLSVLYAIYSLYVKFLAAFSPGFYRIDPRYYIPFWRQSVLPGNHRRVRGESLRGSEGTSALRSPQGDHAEQS